MADLKLWTNEYDLVIAASAEEASQLFRQSDFFDPDMEEDAEAFVTFPHETINWHEECGYSDPVKMSVTELITKLGRGYVGSTEC
jgi:hypothetical protein